MTRPMKHETGLKIFCAKHQKSYMNSKNRKPRSMAFKRTILSSSNYRLTSPLANTQIPNLSLTKLFLQPRRDVKRQRFINHCLKCSFDYKDNHYNQAVEYARPAEIGWKKELCNNVNLIGNVGAPVEIKQLPSGKVLAWTRLAVKKTVTETTWINLTFWDDLAQIAFQHVEKGQQIYVAGRLVSDVVESEEGKQQTYYKVAVQQLNFIERSFSAVASSDRDSESVTSSGKFGNKSPSGLNATELWQAFFANPLDWWDNRKNKRNPKYPDFKHKDTGEALWVEGRYNPPWVKSQLAILDERMGSFRNQNDSMHLSSIAADEFIPF